MVYLDDHGEGEIMEEIPAGGRFYFSFGLLPENQQLLMIPFVMRTLFYFASAILGRYVQRTKRSPRCICCMLGSGVGIK